MIHEITYKENSYPVKCAMGAIMKMQEDTGLSTRDLSDVSKLSLRALETLFFYSLKHGHLERDLPFEISREQSTMMWEDCFEQFNQVMNDSFAALGNTKGKKGAAKP